MENPSGFSFSKQSTNQEIRDTMDNKLDIWLLNKKFEVNPDIPVMLEHSEYPFTLKVKYSPRDILENYYSWWLYGAGQEKPLASKEDQSEYDYLDNFTGPHCAYLSACETLRKHIRAIDSFDNMLDQD